MPNMQPTGRGNVQVTAYGNSNLFCNVGGWYTIGGVHLDVYVYCFDPEGNPADSQFTALYHDNLPNGEDLAYVWANRPTATRYGPHGRYSHNSEWPETGESVTIERIDVGLYQVKFLGWEPLRQHPVSGLWDTTPGILHLTTYDRGPNRCYPAHVSIAPPGHDGEPAHLRVFVACRTPDVEPVDTRFSLAYARDRVLGSPRTIGAYVKYEDREETIDAFFNPLAPYDALPTVTHLDEGRYRVYFPALGHMLIPSTVQVTADIWHLCKVVAWGRAGDRVRVDVNCFNPPGSWRLADAPFYVSFITDRSY